MIAEMAHDEPVLRYRGHILDVTRDGDMHYVHVCGGWDVTCSDALFTAREAATSEQAIENAMSAIDVTIQSMSSGTLNTQGEK
jgi:predicted RNase H-like HicB family nuclease